MNESFIHSQLSQSTYLLIKLLIVLLMASACGGPKRLEPVSARRSREVQQACLRPFPQHPWRAVHRLEASFPIGRQATFIGVTVGDPETQRFRAIGMSVEGVVFFDIAFSDSNVTVYRTVPPFDKAQFSHWLVTYIDLLFLAPTADRFTVGRLKSGPPTCRWTDGNGTMTEIRSPANERWELRRYDRDGRRQCRVEMSGPLQNGLAPWIKVRFYSGGFSSLTLSLIEAELISLEENWFGF